MAHFICQQCKQPLQLDPSLSDLPQSAYTMVADSLPKQPQGSSADSQRAGLSLEQQLARLEIPDDAKNTIKHHRIPSSGHSRTSSSATLKGVAPGESFVILQESVLGGMPPASTSTGKRTAMTHPAGRQITGGIKTTSSPLAHRSTSSTSSAKAGRLSLATTGSSPPSRSNMRPSEKGDVPPTPTSPGSRKSVVEAPLPRTPSHKPSAIRLFSLLSSRTELDHPLCAECTHLMLESLHRQLEETKKERDGYIAFEREVKKQKDAGSAESAESEKQALARIEKLKAEEIEAIRQLRAAEQEYSTLSEELAQLEREEKALEEEEADFWTAYSTSSMAATKLRDQLTSLEHAHAANALELVKLSRTNVYNDAFCIGHDGVFGTINGLRLGRVPSTVVEWSEINAAWGMTLLLLSTIARKVGFVFESWRLVPMGSFSKIERTNGDKMSYELHGSGDLTPGRFFHNRRFDNAMVAFLDCLRQLMEFAQQEDPKVEFPQQVVKDKIGEASIKLQFGQEETWTRALKHVLLALKILLKWATNG
ncbi:autophagy protein 6 [Tulasnella sp. 403]|nr:autophagy protein 6 [Tulasnella sp. 403]